MIGTVKLLAVPNHQLANRQFYLGFYPGNIPPGLVKTYDGVKYTGNIDQRITLPWVASMDSINMVMIGSKVYDIVSYDNNTFAERNTILTIRLNPICTYLKPGMIVGGMWDRTPTMMNPGVRFNVGESALRTSQRYFLERIAGTTHRPYFVLVTAKYDISNATSSSINFYGFFVDYSPEFISRSSDYVYHNTLWASDKYYPPLRTIVNDIDTAFGIPASQIVDVAISARCPYDYSRDEGNNAYGLRNFSGSEIAASIKNQYCYDKITSGNVRRDITDDHDQVIYLSNLERYCGRITVVDEVGNEIAQIPNEWFDSNNQFRFQQETFADVGGIYTNLHLGNGMLVSMQEGHLPWVGDAWSDYQQYSLQYDRQAVQQAVDTTYKEREIAINGQAASAALGIVQNPYSSVSAVGGLAINAWTSGQQADLATGNLYANQARKEAQIRNGPSPNSQMAHGLNYCYRAAWVGGAHIRIEAPYNITDENFARYIDYNGWPCGLYKDLNIQPGYIKGNIFDLPSYGPDISAPGPELDLLRREVAAGFRMVTQ